MDIERAREDRLRRLAKRERLILRESHRRNPDALDYGRYMLVDERNSVAAHGAADEWLTLDEIEEWLND